MAHHNCPEHCPGRPHVAPWIWFPGIVLSYVCWGVAGALIIAALVS